MLDQVKHEFIDNTLQIKSHEGENIQTYATLSKTPSFEEMQMVQAAARQFMISPHIFKKKQVSRFKFAHSVDPIKNLQKQISMFEDDGEEIQVPKSIQDLIERNIRTLSNSLSTAKS